ncbi:MAG: hypothetical protein J6K45_00115, partial [Clostridia bacterium]|nr:hypothetical protein [Clostridia bacterium]
MQKRRDLVKKFIASLIAFSLVFTNFATLGTALVVYAADENKDAINFSAQFVVIENSEQNSEESSEVKQDESLEEQNTTELEGQVDTTMNSGAAVGSIVDSYNEYMALEMSDEQTGEDEISEEELSTYEEAESEPEEELSISEEPVEDAEEPAQTVEEQPVEEPAEEVSEGQVLENGLALEITVGVNDSGYL